MARSKEVVYVPAVKCSKCKQLKPFGEFYKDRSAALYVRAYCKPCDNAQRKQNYNIVKGIVNNG